MSAGASYGVERKKRSWSAPLSASRRSFSSSVTAESTSEAAISRTSSAELIFTGEKVLEISLPMRVVGVSLPMLTQGTSRNANA